MPKPRARTATGRLIHFRQNPPRQRRTCPVCGFNYPVRASDIARNRGITCSSTCRDIRRWLIAQGLMSRHAPSRPRELEELETAAALGTSVAPAAKSLDR